jgi:hypothetical protein
MDSGPGHAAFVAALEHEQRRLRDTARAIEARLTMVQDLLAAYTSVPAASSARPAAPSATATHQPPASRAPAAQTGALAMLDAASGPKTGELSLPGHPESFQLKPNGRRIFVNVPDAQQIAVVDRATSKQVATWRVRDESANFPMAVDHAGERLAVVFRKPALLAVLDTNDGHVVARLPTCDDSDDVFFDAKRQRIYISCGEGALAVIQRQGDWYAELGRIPTVSGARTALWMPDLDRLFLAVRASGREPAAVWVYRPAQ